jgi:serine/threonine-protein kinase
VLLTGQEPFRAESFVDLMMKHLEEPLPSLRQLAPDCPPELAALVERLLAKKPNARPRSALEVQGELARIRRNLDGKDTVKAPRPVVALDELLKPDERQSARTPPVGEAAVRREPGAAPADPATAHARLLPTSAGPAPARIVRRDAATVPAREGVTPAAKLAPVEAAPAPPRALLVPVLALGALVLVIFGAVGWRLWSKETARTDSLHATPDGPKVATPDSSHTGTPGSLEAATPDGPQAATPGAPKAATPDGPPAATPDPSKAAAPDAPKAEAPGAPPTVTTSPTNSGTSTYGKRPRPGGAMTTVASVRTRLDKARLDAARLTSAAARRMMTLDLDRIEERLERGDDPRSIDRELDDILDNYGTR